MCGWQEARLVNLSNVPNLSLVVLLSCLWFSGCELAEDDITNGAATAPVVVRGAYSYMLSIDAEKATIDVRDSAAWYPHVAYLSITVSGYSAGTGTLEVTRFFRNTGLHRQYKRKHGDPEQEARLQNAIASAAIPARVHRRHHLRSPAWSNGYERHGCALHTSG